MTQHDPVVLTQETPMSPSRHGDLFGALADLPITHDDMIDTISLHDGGSLSIEAPGPR